MTSDPARRPVLVTQDLRGKAVRIGDLVGGAVFGRYPDLVTGLVRHITPKGLVRIEVEIGSGGNRPSAGKGVMLQRGHFLRLETAAESRGRTP